MFTGEFSIELPNVSNDEVERIVIFGPTRYIPQPNEWMHQFSWHGSGKKASGEDDKTKKVNAVRSIICTCFISAF